MSSTPPPPFYSTLPTWLFGFTTLANNWFKYRLDLRKAYIDQHSGDNESEDVKNEVKRIRELIDKEFKLHEQGPLVWLCHKDGILVAMLLSIFDFICSCLRGCRWSIAWAINEYPYSNIRTKVGKWCNDQLKRPKNADDIENRARSPSQTAVPPLQPAVPPPQPAVPLPQPAVPLPQPAVHPPQPAVPPPQLAVPPPQPAALPPQPALQPPQPAVQPPQPTVQPPQPAVQPPWQAIPRSQQAVQPFQAQADFQAEDEPWIGLFSEEYC